MINSRTAVALLVFVCCLGSDIDDEAVLDGLPKLVEADIKDLLVKIEQQAEFDQPESEPLELVLRHRPDLFTNVPKKLLAKLQLLGDDLTEIFHGSTVSPHTGTKPYSSYLDILTQDLRRRVEFAGSHVSDPVNRPCATAAKASSSNLGVQPSEHNNRLSSAKQPCWPFKKASTKRGVKQTTKPCPSTTVLATANGSCSSTTPSSTTTTTCTTNATTSTTNTVVSTTTVDDKVSTTCTTPSSTVSVTRNSSQTTSLPFASTEDVQQMSLSSSVKTTSYEVPAIVYKVSSESTASKSSTHQMPVEVSKIDAPAD
ncbi:uncharacterized protein LOC126836992 [Adelges cooleyi]|uniref:uncharacterized protein LOC126836992 n=1 Tax=Adelges cooleyi TaxID=133065 RepID=UPI0021802977|nr:uncharacterized protein LOC126836992 [Adelges cooleyi]